MEAQGSNLLAQLWWGGEQPALLPCLATARILAPLHAACPTSPPTLTILTFVMLQMPDVMLLIASIFAMLGVTMKIKVCSWIALACIASALAKADSSLDLKQLIQATMWVLRPLMLLPDFVSCFLGVRAKGRACCSCVFKEGCSVSLQPPPYAAWEVK